MKAKIVKDRASDLGEAAADVAAQRYNRVGPTIRIEESARQISQIICEIAEISFQTNRLALNAGEVEAGGGDG